MTEEVGLNVRVKIIGQKGATSGLRQDMAANVRQGMSSGAASGVKDITRMLPASLRNAMSGATKILSSIKLPAVTMSAPVDQLSKAMEGATGTWAKGMASSLQAAADKTVFGFKVSDFRNVPGLNVPPPLSKVAEGERGASKGGVLSSFFNSIGNLPFLGGGGGGGAAKGGGAGGAAGAAALAAIAAVEILKGILEAIKAVVQRLTEASPLFRGMLKMLNTGFNLVIKPIGDALGYMIRPIARFFITIGRNINIAMAEKAAELQAQGYSGIALGSALLASYPKILLDALMEAIGAADWDGMFSQMLKVLVDNWSRRVPGFVSSALGAMGQTYVGTLTWIGESLYNTINGTVAWVQAQFDNLATPINNALDSIKNALSPLGETILSKINEGIGSLGNLKTFETWLWGTVTGAVGTLGKLGEFGGWLWDKMINIDLSGVKDFGPWLETHIESAIGDLSGLASRVGDAAYKTLYNVLAAIPNTIRKISFTIPLLNHKVDLSGVIGNVAYLASGGITNGPTLAMIGEGRRGTQREVVSPLSELPRLLGLDRQQQQQTLTPPKIEVIVKGDLYGDNIQRKIEEGVERAIYRARGV